MGLSIVFPAYNEETNIRTCVLSALNYLQGKEGEVIVVDDGSQDSTQSILQKLICEYPTRLRFITHPTNLGYGVALKNGFEAAQHEWIFYSDSDSQFDLSEIDLLWKIKDDADMVIGFRKDRQDPWFRRFVAFLYNRISSFLFHLHCKDIDCAFKLFRKNVFEKIHIESKGFLVDLEILAKASALGLRVKEMGVTHLPRRFGKSTVRFKHVSQTLRGMIALYGQLLRKPKT